MTGSSRPIVTALLTGGIVLGAIVFFRMKTADSGVANQPPLSPATKATPPSPPPRSQPRIFRSRMPRARSITDRASCEDPRMRGRKRARPDQGAPRSCRRARANRGPSPSYVYVGNADSVVRFAYQNGDLKARGPRDVIVPVLPGGGRFRFQLQVFSVVPSSRPRMVPGTSPYAPAKK